MSTSIPGVHDVIRIDDPLIEDHDPVIAHAQRVLNESLAGRLEVDFDTRQIKLTAIRGDIAMRFHKIVSDYREGDPSSARWADHLDPRTADAGDGWITFDVKRIIAVRWFPERLVLGDKDRRQLLFAAIRLVTNKPNLNDPSSLSPQDLRDFAEVLLDMEGEPAATSEPEGDDGDSPAEANDREPEPEEMSPGDESPPHPDDQSHASTPDGGEDE